MRADLHVAEPDMALWFQAMANSCPTHPGRSSVVSAHVFHQEGL